MHNFKELKVWQNARVLTKNIYVVSALFPESERFGLTSQIRSCAVSVPSNIAEGAGRGTDRDFARFLDMSLGSACELETQVIVSYDLEFMTTSQFEELSQKVQEIQKMLIGLQRKLRTKK